jgi:predicted Holliday junction resolvase-like endonuclease
MGKISKKRLIIFLILILIFLIIFTIFNLNLTGKITENKLDYTHTLTKAICNESNYCQDYEIKCKKSEVLEISPITGAVIQKSKDWEDPRENNSLCG